MLLKAISPCLNFLWKTREVEKKNENTLPLASGAIHIGELINIFEAFLISLSHHITKPAPHLVTGSWLLAFNNLVSLWEMNTCVIEYTLLISHWWQAIKTSTTSHYHSWQFLYQSWISVYRSNALCVILSQEYCYWDMWGWSSTASSKIVNAW